MRFSFVPFFEVNLGVVVSLFLLWVAVPRLIGLLVRSMIGLLASIIFRRLLAHGLPLALAWMADGWLETKTSLVIQSVILLLINAIGVWRWFPKAEKEAKS